ncbi:DUF2249 domain-containing protein [Alicyclobacillaceae bacterium I2511]|nr:DUF2249 domain-containing protein [Alicyclobacillaceae bacterium I2511]
MGRKIVELDVREILRRKEEPFQGIMQTVNALDPQDVLELRATFEPAPLLRVLGKQGLRSIVNRNGEDDFTLQFYRDEASALPYWHLDNRGLEPPQPMVRALGLLDGVDAYGHGERGLEIWNERVPALLLPELEERGYQYEFEDVGHQTVVIRIHR